MTFFICCVCVQVFPGRIKSPSISYQRSWREFPIPPSPLYQTPLPPLPIPLSKYPPATVIFFLHDTDNKGSQGYRSIHWFDPETHFISPWTHSFLLRSMPILILSLSLWVARSKQHVPHHHKSGSTPPAGNYVDYMIVEPPQSPLQMQTASMDPYTYHQVHTHTRTVYHCWPNAVQGLLSFWQIWHLQNFLKHIDLDPTDKHSNNKS